MNQQQIQWVKSLPNAESDGTICSLLLRDDLATIPFEKALSYLVQALVNDKLTLQAEGRKMSKILKRYDLYGLILEED